ncbi:MAG TPA: amidohydrolase family protein [Solirubrobacteraceae bacterium]|jgi:predicted TIM-barrel fold metal-dependent hydrolase|nr:amidohydrolase family protein [Solirubrobacteraceae bacterium]
MSLERYRQAVLPFEEEVLALRPSEGEVIDVHTHLGLDEDGRSLTRQALVEMMDQAGVARVCVFPLHDPERHPAYRLPNDRVLQWAGEADGRLVPFCRLDPAETPIDEGRRALSAGARGIKLHPRAQAFGFIGPEIDSIFSLAEQTGVPMLIHAGRGLPPVGDQLAEALLRHPALKVILAHAAICDMGILTDRLADHEGVLYDTSCMFAADILNLFARVPAQRIVFGSDPPYGHPSPGQYLVLRVAKAMGLSTDQLRLVLGDTAAQMIDHGRLPERTEPRGEHRIQTTPTLLRLQLYGAMIVPYLFRGDIGMAQAGIDMALAVCRDPHPGAAAPALEMIAPALAAARELLADEQMRRLAIDLLHRSISLAATELF